MKSKFTLILVIFNIAIVSSIAQINNPGFEDLNEDGTLQNWGKTYIFSIGIDTSGGNVDTIQFDKYLLQSSDESRTGLHALELRNAYDHYNEQSIVGAAYACKDNFFGGFIETCPVPGGSKIELVKFHYKYIPVGNDFGSCGITIFDSLGYEIGSGYVELNAADNYTEVIMPVEYFTTDSSATYSLYFSNAGIGSEVSFGTRLLVDDVSFEVTSKTKSIENSLNLPPLYPNPTSGPLTLNSKEIYSAEIMNSAGKTIKMTTSQNLNLTDLSAGIYIIKLSKNGKEQNFRITKK